MKDLELILENIELSEPNANGLFDVFWSETGKSFRAISENSSQSFVYELTDSQETIETMHRQEILEYCLGTVTKECVVGLGDIFMHFKYVKKL